MQQLIRETRGPDNIPVPNAALTIKAPPGRATIGKSKKARGKPVRRAGLWTGEAAVL